MHSNTNPDHQTEPTALLIHIEPPSGNRPVIIDLPADLEFKALRVLPQGFQLTKGESQHESTTAKIHPGRRSSVKVFASTKHTSAFLDEFEVKDPDQNYFVFPTSKVC